MPTLEIILAEEKVNAAMKAVGDLQKGATIDPEIAKRLLADLATATDELTAIVNADLERTKLHRVK